ncbi:unnamed protein product [Coffea canephora]|uniref:DH200=94 genomic scaffold, scaffold_1636 n=1 Tax=Coffea canephora TaxID=49390 RepID=A0A068VJ60_COFCA|nr:unnamed protein product [Coffea canephora]
MASEHFASFLVFIIIRVVALVYYIKGILSLRMLKVLLGLCFQLACKVICYAMVTVLIALVASSATKGWSGRSLSLLDPCEFMICLESIEVFSLVEWLLISNLSCLQLQACFLPLSDASSFSILYIVTLVYFSGVMVPLMLVLGPAVCKMPGISLSGAFDVLTYSLKFQNSFIFLFVTSLLLMTEKNPIVAVMNVVAFFPIIKRYFWLYFLVLMLDFHVVHCVWAAAEACSIPFIVLTSQSHDGLRIFYDFKEDYAWLSHNTDVDHKVSCHSFHNIYLHKF